MHIIIGILVFGAVAWWLLRNVEAAPPTTTEDELRKEGLTSTEIRKELRAQRQEQRIHSITQSQALRTANALSKSAVKIAKKRL